MFYWLVATATGHTIVLVQKIRTSTKLAFTLILHVKGSFLLLTIEAAAYYW